MTKAALLWIPAFPLLGAVFNLVFGRYLSRRSVHTVAVAAVVASFAYALYLVGGPLWDAFQVWRGATPKAEVMGGLYQNVYTWIEVGTFKIDLAFRMDTLAAVMVLIITFVGALIHIYSTGYMAEEPRYPAYFGYLNLFTGAMLILVLGNNLPVMFIGWEGVGLCSYLLIGFWYQNESFAYAGRKAFIVNRIGDFSFLLGICLLFLSTGSLDFWAPNGGLSLMSDKAVAAYVSPYWGGEHLALWAGLFLFIGACGKSAQIPLYVWLPDAMAGPTPVSALIHAATMVTAGVYMIARLSFLYAHSTTAMAIVAGVGALTALFAAIMAFAQTDLKKVLAYSTVSQLGFMFVGVGVGAYVAGVFHLLTHAFFKAGLFLAAGSVMHAMSGSGDITKMGGLRRLLPRTHFSFLVYCLAIAGIFPFAGFFSKDEILAGAFSANSEGWLPIYGEMLWTVLSLAALGTAFYMFRLYFLVFSGESRADEETKSHIHESPWSMTGPLLVLAAFTVVLGFIGLPHLSFLHDKAPNLLSLWLEPSLVDLSRSSVAGTVQAGHGSDITQLVLMGVALVVGVVGISAAYALYAKGPSSKVATWVQGWGADIHRVVKNKFYVDEFYDRVVLRPFRWAALGVFEIIDRFLIDWVIVEGSAFVVDMLGRVVRWFQNGQVQRYMVAVLIGAAGIIYFASKPTPEFSWEQTGDLTVEFVADIGSGPGTDGAVVEFDFDGDGKMDHTATSTKGEKTVEVTWAFAQAGSYQVTMSLKDAVFEKTGSVTRTVSVEETVDPRARPTKVLEERVPARAGGVK